MCLLTFITFVFLFDEILQLLVARVFQHVIWLPSRPTPTFPQHFKLDGVLVQSPTHYLADFPLCSRLDSLVLPAHMQSESNRVGA